MKLKFVIQMCKSLFPVKNSINTINISCTESHINFGYLTKYAWRWLEVDFRSVTSFFSIALNANAFCYANTVEKQCTRLLKCNRICCLLFDIIVRCCLFNGF